MRPVTAQTSAVFELKRMETILEHNYLLPVSACDDVSLTATNLRAPSLQASAKRWSSGFSSSSTTDMYLETGRQNW